MIIIIISKWIETYFSTHMLADSSNVLWSFTLRSFQCRLWSLFSVGSSQVVYVYSRGLLRKASVNRPVRGTSQLLFARQIRLPLRHFPEGRLSVIHELQQCGTSWMSSVWQSARLRLWVCSSALDKWSKSCIVHSIRALWLSYYPVNAEAVWIGSADMIFWLSKHQTRALHPSAAKLGRDTVRAYLLKHGRLNMYTHSFITQHYWLRLW